MSDSIENHREKAHIEAIITDSLDIVESEHGIWGLDHVAQIIKERRFAVIQKLEDARKA